VLTVLEGGILTATLNRPEKRNAIDSPMIEALLAMLERADLDAGVRVIALRGAGTDFCAGMDLSELLASADRTVAENRQAALQFAEIFLRMRRLPKPIAALVHGRALAGGCGLATACDLVLATGRIVTASEAAGLGLVSRVYEDSDFAEQAGEVLRGLAATSPSALAFTKQQFYQLDGLRFEDAIRLGADVNAVSRTTPDFRAALQAFLRK